MEPIWATVINNGFLAVIAICTVVGTVLAYRANANTAATREAVTKQSDTITKLEVNTNSMKDALVNSTALHYQATGRAEGIASERANPQVPSGDAVMPPLPPVPPIPSPQVIVKEAGKETVSAVNVRIIPDQTIPVKQEE